MSSEKSGVGLILTVQYTLPSQNQACKDLYEQLSLDAKSQLRIAQMAPNNQQEEELTCAFKKQPKKRFKSIIPQKGR